MATSSNNIFKAAKQLATQLNNIPPIRLGDADCTYGLPRESGLESEKNIDAFYVRELLVAAAHTIDPSVALNSSVQNCRIIFRSPYEKFPTHQIHAALDGIHKDLTRTAQRTEHGLHFSLSEGSTYPLDFVLRAALPAPEQFEMHYALPEGEYRDGSGKATSGIVTYEKLIDLLDTAEHEQNHEALTELHQSHCVSAEISHEQAQKLSNRLGLNFDGKAVA